MATNPTLPDFSEIVSSFKSENDNVRLETANRLLEDVRGSVVKVIAGGHACDGFFIEDGTKIVTSNELFQTPGADKDIEIQTDNGALLKGHVECRDDKHEEVVVALDGVKQNQYKGLKLGSTDSLTAKDAVYLYGHKEADFQDESKKAVLGIGTFQMRYTAKAEQFGAGVKTSGKHKFLDSVLPRDLGMSGSPLLNEDGEVIGMYQKETPTTSTNPHKALVVCDDVAELKEVRGETEPDNMPTKEQAEEIANRLGKLNKPTVIEFEADWCVYCKKQQPLLDKAEQTYGQDINVVRLNVDKDENADLAAAYGVQGLPCTIFIGVSPDGELLRQETLTGYGPGAFQQLIDQLMADRAKDKPAQ